MSETSRAREERLRELQRNFGANGTFSLLGIGVAFRGKRYRDENDRTQGIIITTRWVVLLWLPVIPLGTYRIRWAGVKQSSSGRMTRRFQLVSEQPLAWGQIFLCWGMTIAIVGAVVALMDWLG